MSPAPFYGKFRGIVTDNLDPLMIGLAVRRRIHCLARKTLFRNPLFGNYLRSVGCVPVDQDGVTLLEAFWQNVSRVTGDERHVRVTR